METSEILNSLPEVNVLDEEGITPESIIAEMVESYEEEYEKITGEELTLYPGDERKIRINAAAEVLYQLACIGQERFRQNFLKTACDESLINLGANIGFYESGTENARATLRFTLSEARNKDITIPAGTRATAGDQIYFATEEDAVIKAGDTYIDTSAACEEYGSAGNGYTIGQINTIVDPVNYVESVENIDESHGGSDEYTNDERREKIFEFPSSYSVAGPQGAYEYMTKKYSSNITDVRVINEDAVVKIYFLMQDGNIPDKVKLKAVENYLKESKRFPDTDHIETCAPEEVQYELTMTYYIPYDSKDTEDAIKDDVESMIKEFVEHTAGRIGRAIDPGLLNAFVRASGARAEISSPQYQKIGKHQVAKCGRMNITYGGLERE